MYGERETKYFFFTVAEFIHSGFYLCIFKSTGLFKQYHIKNHLNAHMGAFLGLVSHQPPCKGVQLT